MTNSGLMSSAIQWYTKEIDVTPGCRIHPLYAAPEIS